ncbi:MAG: enoyl-CoA hydratase/isomerase family protein [Nannocystaceae bacterium]|nr:enoyl-CoA hydratase/isomerase family protein [bacterium]
MAKDLLLREHRDGVTTLTMNNPDRLNGWTVSMLEALGAALREADRDEETKVIVLTGTGRYYCAGVNLGGTLKLDHPASLYRFVLEHNEELFDQFLRLRTPILIAANGPAIGASVTSATLCDGIVASENATFSTPFAALRVPAEGCSSETFPKLLGEEAAHRMLGPEGWKPTAAEAAEIGLVQWVVPPEELMSKAHSIAQQWIEEGHTRTYPAGFTRAELEAINARESKVLAKAFLSPPFLMAQYEFLWGKGKRQTALLFLGLAKTHRAWKHLLPPEART